MREEWPNSGAPHRRVVRRTHQRDHCRRNQSLAQLWTRGWHEGRVSGGSRFSAEQHLLGPAHSGGPEGERARAAGRLPRPFVSPGTSNAAFHRAGASRLSPLAVRGAPQASGGRPAVAPEGLDDGAPYSDVEQKRILDALSPRHFAHSRDRIQASMRCSSPDSIRARVSSAPPISVPLTNTIGRVGQPVHILSALRRRHEPVYEPYSRYL